MGTGAIFYTNPNAALANGEGGSYRLFNFVALFPECQYLILSYTTFFIIVTSFFVKKSMFLAYLYTKI